MFNWTPLWAKEIIYEVDDILQRETYLRKKCRHSAETTLSSKVHNNILQKRTELQK